MSTSALEVMPRASRVRCTDVELVVAFDDGRTLSVPLVWFPPLLDATAEQRANWRLTGQGEGDAGDLAEACPFAQDQPGQQHDEGRDRRLQEDAVERAGGL